MPLGRILPRHASRAIAEALADTRVVLITGARQAGKSTIVRQLTAHSDAVLLNLDNAATRQSAQFDPTSFVRAAGMLAIDEVQRVPELLLAIKEVVDVDQRPGRFLLTGSARLLGMRNVPDALPGRMETIELWPLSQGEIEQSPDGFVDAVFKLGPELNHRTTEGRQDYIRRLVRGGFPEAVARQGRRRESFFDNYVSDLVSRDVIQLSEIERGPQMRALIRALAARSGSLLVPGTLANELQLPRSTVERYLSLLEEVFLIKRTPAFSRNLSSRAVATAKVSMVDSGIAANLVGHDERSLSRLDAPLGGLLEAFVAMELARQLTWSDTRAELFHYRTKDKTEVDIVLEDRQGRAIAIEVKASATVRPEDFRGINHLAARLGDDLLAGIVLYTGTDTLPFGPSMRAIPIAALWEVAG